MNCLYCAEQIASDAPIEETNHGWHKKCLKQFFGIEDMPVIELTSEIIEQLAYDAIDRGMSLPGFQKKLSLQLSRQDVPRLTVVDYPVGYILKPQTDQFRSLPEAEDLGMRLAKLSGVATVHHGLIKMNDSRESRAYITRRIDRQFDGGFGAQSQRFAMEDFCQLSLRLTEDKYKGSYEACAKLIERYSDQPGLDLAEFFLRLLVSFVTGNSDMHLKNFSLIERTPRSRKFILAPAYDLLPVNLILPEDKEEMALTLNGKKSNLKRNDFYTLAKRIGLSDKVADNMLDRVLSLKAQYIELCHQSYLPQDMKQAVIGIISDRLNRLSAGEKGA